MGTLRAVAHKGGTEHRLPATGALMSDDTTGPAASDESGQPDYQAKYNGLMRAFSKRTSEFSEQEQAWATERETLAAQAAKVAEYEQRDAAANAEAQELAEFERLQEKFEKEPPPPQQPNEQNHIAWQPRYPLKDAEEASDIVGFPT